MFRVITKKNILAYDSFRWLSLTLTERLTRWLTGWHAYRCFAQSVLLWCMLYALRGRLIKLHGTCNCFVSNLFGVRNIWEFHASHRTVNVSALWSGIKISRANECEVRVYVDKTHCPNGFGWILQIQFAHENPIKFRAMFHRKLKQSHPYVLHLLTAVLAHSNTRSHIMKTKAVLRKINRRRTTMIHLNKYHFLVVCSFEFYSANAKVYQRFLLNHSPAVRTSKRDPIKCIKCC